MGGHKDQCIRWGPDPPTGGALLRGHDVSIFPHSAVMSAGDFSQRSDSTVADAVGSGVTLNFFNNKSAPSIGLSSKFFDQLLLFFF